MLPRTPPYWLSCLLLLIGSPSTLRSAEDLPPLPIGLDAYRQWERWPDQRIGLRAYMRSTYDRRGGNEGADASHFLYQLADDANVTLDVEGPGVLCFARFNHWHGSPWRYTIDGLEHVIEETTTTDPTRPAANSVFLPEGLFPPPLGWTWSVTKGADLNWTPMGFEKSLRLAYSRTRYGTGYYIYQQVVPGLPLSQPIRAWNGRAPDEDVLNLLSSAGSDLAPKNGVGKLGGGALVVGKDTVLLLGEIEPGAPAMLRALEFSAPRGQAPALGRTRLRVTWDGEASPSIDAPLALFFGAGALPNGNDSEYLVKAFPVSVRYDEQRVHLACYFPMPFFHSARLELLGNSAIDIQDLRWNARIGRFPNRPSSVGYFHATYRDHPHPARGQDLVLLDTREVEGGGDWSGQFIGTSFIFSDRANLNTLEGDPRFFFDDSQTPQAQGTGTEEWGGGGDYWGGKNMTLPFAGHPTGVSSPIKALDPDDETESAYRFLLGDLMPFGRNAVIHLEHGGENDSTEHYQTVTYWYGRRGATLIKTDALQIGDERSETAHRYTSPEASPAYEISSRFEWGPDAYAQGGKPVEIYPAQTDRGRKTTGASEFTLKLDPRNVGVLLRRKLDYAFPNQRAEVFVADETGAWKPAGVWYLAGSNTCVYSNPKGELGATEHHVEASNRRFRDDEFLLGRELTQRRAEIRVRVRFAPNNIPLFPGRPLDEQAWSEIRYDAYCFVSPEP